MRRIPRAFRLGLLAAVVASASLLPLSHAQVTPVAAAAPDSEKSVTGALWRSARSGKPDDLQQLVDRLASQDGAALGPAAKQFNEHLEAREKARAARIATVREEIVKHLAADRTDVSLAKALRAIIELHMLSKDKDAVLREEQVKDTVSRCEAAAHAAEARGDIVSAGELFVLLDALMDTAGTYRPDVRRIGARQEMLRMYAPERMWELRNHRALQDEEAKPLPPYNPFGDDWKVKLEQIDKSLLEYALMYTRRHVEQLPMRSLLVGGLEHVRTMVTTQDLARVFPGLGDERARADMLAFLDDEQAKLNDRASDADTIQTSSLLSRLQRKNSETVKIAPAALWHEFGNGATSRLDEFSEIIWPDEVRRFNKNTQSKFVGVGVQIEYDELQNIRVVTPIDDTPAQRAGLHPGDIITKVDGRAIYGLSLDQAVDVITGPENTFVTLTVDRAVAPTPGAEGGDKPAKQSLDFRLKRSVINVVTVKGWRREGIKEDDWSWFIDPDADIGYVRLSNFAETTAAELDRAVARMKQDGLRGLILDLRFNPGGLLDQAVRVSQRFIDTPNGLIVASRSRSNPFEDPFYAEPSVASLAGIPVVVLVNEGSASASEIVSGAIQRYADKGQADAVVLGQRSFGKGSVQNVWPVNANAYIKVTTSYYMLPDHSMIHRKPGSLKWGVEPNITVEMLPEQTREAIIARRDADLVPMNENGRIEPDKPRINPDDLVSKGTDLQVEAALLLLRARVSDGSVQTARGEKR